MKNPNITSFALNKTGNFNQTTLDSDLYMTNDDGELQVYHFDYLQWKWPSEHTIDNKQYAAELQIYHTQRVTTNKVALSFLFSTDMANDKGDRAKKCFVDSFDFSLVKPILNTDGI